MDLIYGKERNLNVIVWNSLSITKPFSLVIKLRNKTLNEIPFFFLCIRTLLVPDVAFENQSD